jgi:hypothetical protein
LFFGIGIFHDFAENYDVHRFQGQETFHTTGHSPEGFR